MPLTRAARRPVDRARPRARRAAAALAAVALSAACAETTPTRRTGSGGELRVVTTVAPLTSIASNVAGDRATITGLVPEGTNSHTFEPPPSAAAVLEDADVVFVNGLRLEEPTLALAKANLRPGAEVVELGTTVLPKEQYVYDFSFPREEGKPNPHLWTDPIWAAKYADLIKDVLVRRDPDNAEHYRRNHEAFVRKATELAQAMRADQETIPAGKKLLLTYHDAYAYFAKTFGWEVVGAVQPESFDEPTPGEVARIIDDIRRRGVPTVFGSEVFPSRVLEQIAKETGARYEASLRDDDLPGEPGDAEHSWLGLMRYDYVTMVEGLGGTAKNLRALDVSDVAPDEATYPQ